MTVVLERARIGLFSDPSTQIEIPHLTGFQATRGYDGTVVRFVGDDYPTGFRGEGKTRAYAMTARYLSAERAQMKSLLDMFDLAHGSPDSRLLLRTHIGQIAGLDTAEAIQVFQVQPAAQSGRFWDLNFTAQVVNHTFAV